MKVVSSVFTSIRKIILNVTFADPGIMEEDQGVILIPDKEVVAPPEAFDFQGLGNSGALKDVVSLYSCNVYFQMCLSPKFMFVFFLNIWMYISSARCC